MLKRIVQEFFVILGGALGFIFYPELISILSLELPGWIASDYVAG